MTLVAIEFGLGSGGLSRSSAPAHTDGLERRSQHSTKPRRLQAKGPYEFQEAALDFTAA
jgi:hypothetical protein